MRLATGRSASYLGVGYVQGEQLHVIVHAMLAREKFLPVMTIPRSVDEILAHADELAARFENFEPDPAHELDANAVALLREAVTQRSEAERHVIDAVRAAREAGISWSAIGTFLGTSGEAARQRYGSKVA